MPRADLPRTLVIVLTAVLVLTGLTSCTTAPTPAATSVSSLVDARGFSLETKHASASGGAGVAAKNTEITLSEVKHTFAGPPVADLRSIGTPVRLRLGKDAQPKTPITIRLKVDTSKISKESWSNPQTYAILEQSAGATTSTLLPATYDAKSGDVIAITDHLSFFSVVQIVLSSFIDKLGTTVLHAIGAEYDAPECADKQLSTSLNGAAFSTSGSWAIDPCLTTKNGALVLKLYSTTGLPFKVTSSPDGETSPLPGLSATSLAQQVTFDLLFSEKNAHLVGPGGELDYTYASPGTTTLSFEEAPAMLYVATLIDVLSFLAPEKSIAKEALNHLDSLSCMAQIVSTAQAAKTLTTALAGQLVSSFVSCAGKAFIDEKDSVIWAMATAAPSLLVNMALGIVTEIGGQGNFRITIHAIAPQPVLGSALGVDPNGNSEGYGTVRPKLLFAGGDPTSYIDKLTWDSWGGPTARGHGEVCDPQPNQTVAECPIHEVEVLVSAIGTCDGKRAYTQAKYWIPVDGETETTTDWGGDGCG